MGNGTAPVVVLLHGGGLNAHTWDRVCLALRSRYPCLAVDLRGHGDSEWSPEADYSLDAHRQDLEGFVGELALSRFALVGHSLGAFVGLHYAARHPEALAGYVAVDATPFVRDGSAAKGIVDFMLGRDAFVGIDDAVDYAGSFNPERDPRGLRRGLEHSLRKRPDGRWTWKHDRRYLSPAGFEALVSAIRGLLPEARAITCPTLVVRGGRSPGVSADEAGDFAAVVARGRTVVVDDAGHNVQSDNPAGLAEALDAFLGALR